MIFRYPGGKSKKSIREEIICSFPKKYSEYRDPMVGGGGIFFAIPTNKKRWINDLDKDLISVYEALQTNPDSFIRECREIKPHKKSEPTTPSKPNGKAKYNARLKSEFDRLNSSDSDPALRYLFTNRTVWGGRVNYDIPSRMYFSNPQGWNVVHTQKMEKAAQIIKNSKITSGSYRELIEKEGEDVLIYLDPPYCVNTNLDKNSRLYKHNFEKKDHLELFDVVKNSKHKILISYDKDPLICNLYKDFNLKETGWVYCGTSSAKTHSNEKRIGKELIITNY